MTRLLCTGDWHLGAGAAFGKAPGDRLQEQADIALRIFEIAREHEVDGVLLAGDSFEGPAVTPEQMDAFIRPIETSGIPILAIPGNGRHDSAMRSTNALIPLRHVPGLTISTTPAIHDVAGVKVATLPWAPISRLVAAQGGGDRDAINDQAATLLLTTARGLRAQITDGPAVLMLHWSVSGASLPTGLPTDLLAEPVLELGALEALGFDAVVMGHIHRRQVLDDEGRIFYVGSPMPLNFGEASCNHGVWLLDIDEAIRPRRVHADVIPIESRRFLTIDIDLVDDPRDPMAVLFEAIA
jgi:exonuclease SbcD